MCAGEPHFAAGVLHVPCMRGDELIAVARVGTEGGLAPDAADACLRLCGISALVLWNARQLSAGGRSDGDASETLRDAATGLPSRGFFDLALDTEVHKAKRYGRRLSCICIDTSGETASDPARDAAVEVIASTLRTSDVLASEDGERFWVLVTDNDALGGVVLKRRLADRVRDALDLQGRPAGVAVGMATFPQDGESGAELRSRALANLESERQSIVHALGLRSDMRLDEMSRSWCVTTGTSRRASISGSSS